MQTATSYRYEEVGPLFAFRVFHIVQLVAVDAECVQVGQPDCTASCQSILPQPLTVKDSNTLLLFFCSHIINIIFSLSGIEF